MGEGVEFRGQIFGFKLQADRGGQLNKRRTKLWQLWYKSATVVHTRQFQSKYRGLVPWQTVLELTIRVSGTNSLTAEPKQASPP